jgi:outer membrane protein assembly factor BamB
MFKSRLVVVWFVVGFCSSIAFSDDWPRWRGPNLDGISRESNWTAEWPQTGPKLLWTCEVGTGFSSIVVQGERAYTMGHVDENDVIYCLDVNNGETLWKHEYPSPLDDRDFEGGPTSTPTIDGDRLYALSRAGDLFCLNRMTGSVHWQIQVAEAAEVRVPGWGFSAPPLVVGNKLVLNVGESGAVLDKSNGKIVWSSADKECGYASPVVITGASNRKVVFASARAFIGVDLETGKQLWSERWLTSFNCNAADPIIHDSKMFVSSGYNRGAALFDLQNETPKLVWKTKELQNQLHSSLLYDNHLYGIDGDMDDGPRLKCVEWSTGKVVWSVDELRPGGLSIADGKLLILTQSGELLVAPATPHSFSTVARGQVLQGKCWTVPVLANGRVYCRSVQGQVACVDCRE